MEISSMHPYSWDVLYNSYPLPFVFPFSQFLENYVHWTQTPESHIYSADIPGVRKEEIKVELVDSKYLIIRTDMEAVERERSFKRKFRLPSRICLEGISAGYENGLLTVTVPRSDVRRGFYIDPSDLPDNSSLEVTARAA